MWVSLSQQMETYDKMLHCILCYLNLLMKRMECEEMKISFKDWSPYSHLILIVSTASGIRQNLLVPLWKLLSRAWNELVSHIKFWNNVVWNIFCNPLEADNICPNLVETKIHLSPFVNPHTPNYSTLARVCYHNSTTQYTPQQCTLKQYI